MPRWLIWALLGALAAFLIGFALENGNRGSLSEWLFDGLSLTRNHYFEDGYFSALLWPMVGFGIGALVSKLRNK